MSAWILAFIQGIIEVARLWTGRQRREERKAAEKAGAAKSQNKAHQEAGKVMLDMNRARDNVDHSEDAILSDPNRRKPK